MIAWGSGSAVFFNIGINILVLPRYGYLGASSTTVITEVLMAVCFFWVLQRSFFHLSIKGRGLRLGISGGLMGLFLWGLKTWPLSLTWPLALVCYGAALILFRLLTREDWMLLKRLVVRSPAQAEAKR